MSDSPERQERRIVIELLSSADVKRLEARDEDLRTEIARLEKRIEGIHDTMYKYFESVSQLKNR